MSSSVVWDPLAAQVVWAYTDERCAEKSDPDFQQQFIGNTLFAPSWIVEGHFLNGLLNVGGHRRTTARARFPLPEETESFAMPSNQRVGLTTIKAFCQSNQRDRRASVKRMASVGRHVSLSAL
jgi:hypothetical protein